MKLPYMQSTKSKTKEYVISFLGLNYGAGCKEGELADSLNLTNAAFPNLTQRPARAVHKTLESPTALYAKGSMCYVDGTTFYYNDVAKGTVTAGEKQIVAVNSKIVIWPDKKCYDTAEDTFTDLPLTYTATAGTISFTASSTACTIVTAGTAFTFKVNDAVKVTGCTTLTANNDITGIVRAVSSNSKTLTFDPGVFVAGSEAAAVVVAREVPDIDFICEHDNRLWGCKGSLIYASALGDPFNFHNFDLDANGNGASTSSYAVPVGSDGDFTGITSYSTHLMFHKDHVVHKLYGTKPSNYEIVDGNFQGIMPGCHKSAVIINSVLYFMSREGIMAYTGSTPYAMSEAFGEKRFKNAVAGTDGVKYYVSMQDNANSWGLYVFDTKKRLWIREDAMHALDMALYEGGLYILSSDKKIYLVDSGTETITWSATFCRFDETGTETKGYSRFNLRAELEAGSHINVEISVDGKPFQTIKTISSPGRKVYAIPILPTRCDSIQIRLSGKGRSKIYALTREFNAGSDLH